MSRHREQAGAAMHTLIRWRHANASARLAEPVAPDDVGKRSLQEDNLTIWDLVSTAPKLWVQSGASASSDPSSVQKLSNAAISAGRVVRYVDATHVGYADANTLAHASQVAGISATATGGAEQQLTVLLLGTASDNGWAWTPGQPVFVGANGALTQTFNPAWAWLVQVGVAISPTQIAIDLTDAVRL